MCNPAVIPYIFMAVTAVAGVAEAQTQRRAGEANAQISENNARLAEASAEDAAVQGARESQQAAWRTRALIGSQRANIAANGLDADVGSAYDIQAEAALLGGAEQSVLSMNAARQAWGFGAEALNYRNKGAQEKWFGKESSKVTILKTIGYVGSQMGGMGGGGMFSKAGGSSFAANSNVTTINTGANYANYG